MPGFVPWELAAFSSLVVQTVIHELGHAIAVLLVGFQLREIHLGSERRKVATIAGVGVFLGLRRQCFVRYVSPDASPAVARRRFVSLAGPLANLAGAPFALHAGDGWMFMFVWIGIVVGLINLLPLRSGKRPSDGWTVLHAREVATTVQARHRIQASQVELKRVAASYTDETASAWLDEIRRLAHDPDTGAAAGLLLFRVSWATGNLADDLPRLQSFVDGTRLVPKVRAALAHAIAFGLQVDDGPYRRDDAEARGIADRYSALAAQLDPTVQYLHTRTEVVRRLGRPADPLVAQQAWKLMSCELTEEERSQLPDLLGAGHPAAVTAAS